jgi:pimeloyl-ACP methyl ester carboxylesterase
MASKSSTNPDIGVSLKEVRRGRIDRGPPEYGPPVAYDEFGLFHENAEEAGLPWNGPPSVSRVEVATPSGHPVSALVWGEPGAAPELVLVHGGAQNAHTWDTVALALRRPLVAIDLPGHGHSAWRDDHDYRPASMAPDVAAAIDRLAPDAKAVVGMSLGGMTSLALAGIRPDLVRRLVLVDITPGVNREKAAAVIAFVAGPETFASFDEILARTIEHNPTRSESSLRRGVLHNAAAQPDGTWAWRYDRLRFDTAEGDGDAGGDTGGAGDAGDLEQRLGMAELWEILGNLTCPLFLARGGISPVVDDADVAEVLRRQPGARVEVVDGAGHSIQGDRPVELAGLLDSFIS